MYDAGVSQKLNRVTYRSVNQVDSMCQYAILLPFPHVPHLFHLPLPHAPHITTGQIHSCHPVLSPPPNRSRMHAVILLYCFRTTCSVASSPSSPPRRHLHDIRPVSFESKWFRAAILPIPMTVSPRLVDTIPVNVPPSLFSFCAERPQSDTPATSRQPVI